MAREYNCVLAEGILIGLSKSVQESLNDGESLSASRATDFAIKVEILTKLTECLEAVNRLRTWQQIWADLEAAKKR